MSYEVSATRAGAAVRIYTRSTGPHGKIHGAYLDRSTDNWHQACWQSTGFFHEYDSKEAHQLTCAIDLVDASNIKKD